jgi:hypothetical protein
MTAHHSTIVRALTAMAWLAVASSAAAGDETAQAPVSGGAGQGPMIVERIQGGFLAAPDVKITTVDRRTSELVGGYAGWLTDKTFFVGGSGYWLVNNSSSRSMAYGGVDIRWLARTDRRIGWSISGLIGGGEATLGDPRIEHFRRRFDRETFFVAEPEATVLVRLSRRMRLSGGAGYRAIESGRHDDGRLSGATGTVSLQIGGGF